jgi:hypothetical protein
MLRFATGHNFFYPYLIDHAQSIGKQYNVICTPNFLDLTITGNCSIVGGLMNSQKNISSSL